ncbi:hypothetical protein GGI26_006243 [Coemansia sp. RSA 1358]|nr:hypothetical protein GGI26_006243 [Coemansia sp. RSA 1358]
MQLGFPLPVYTHHNTWTMVKRQFTQRRSAFPVVIAFSILLAFAYLSSYQTTAEDDTYHQSQNATLGFQKIYVLNMPSRIERRRNMKALAKFHGLQFDYAQTFDAGQANTLARASNYLINGTHLGCYLSHMHIYRHMVDEDIETALILEDDIDMELDLKKRHRQIMDEVYKRYKADWDMLYLGHCTSDSSEPAIAAFNATPPIDNGGLGGSIFIDPADRAAFLARGLTLYDAEYPMCLHAYAVTRECAKRLAVLLEERLKTLGQDIDLVLAVGVQFGFSTVLGTSPPYIVQIGRQELTSDLAQLKDGNTAQRLSQSTLFHLKLRTTNPQTLPPYIDWPWFTAQNK